MEDNYDATDIGAWCVLIVGTLFYLVVFGLIGYSIFI